MFAIVPEKKVHIDIKRSTKIEAKNSSSVVTKDDYTKLLKNVGALQDTLMAFRKNMALDAIALPQKSIGALIISMSPMLFLYSYAVSVLQ
ncbi:MULTISPECIES: hypothetical protein [Anaerotignum]|uniref:hypothetical protein n=1 Tax=Anaerotignum TaxID=2039240 RepID=UPI00210C2FE9|nr:MULTISPECIES: hypothetical protein [Anaerotignum]MCQ4934950.1 hypothetical protein [Anaerotignum propionicum]